MGAKKDIKRVRELIFGEYAQEFEDKFSAIHEALDVMTTEHEAFKQEMAKQLKGVNKTLERLDERQVSFANALQHQGHKMDVYMEDLTQSMKQNTKESKEELKTLKNELKMHIEAKLNKMNQVKISHNDLSDMFLSLSKDLVSKDSTEKNAREQ